MAMNKKLLLVAAAATLAMAVLASTAVAHPEMGPRLPGPYGCLDMSMPVPSPTAKQVVLVALHRTVNGIAQDDSGITLKWYRLDDGKKVGMAHPGCWTAIPIAPRKLNYRSHSSILCIMLRNGNAMADQDTAFAACPKPVIRITMGPNGQRVRWRTIIFEVVSPAK
jgi:hypothetical protein